MSQVFSKKVKLHSEPIVNKILVTKDTDQRDVYGFEVNQNYKHIQVSSLATREFVYSGGWLGGYGPHGQGELEVVEYGDLVISELFDRGSFICKNLPKKFVLSDGSIDPIFFVTQYRHKNILKNSFSECEVISECYVNVFTGKISTAVFATDNPISNMKLYMNGKMSETDVQSPLTYSGKFDWETATQLSGSINGSSVQFDRAVSYVSAIKEEFDVFDGISTHLMGSNAVYTLCSIDDVIELKSLLFKSDYKLLHRIFFEFENYEFAIKQRNNQSFLLEGFKRIIKRLFQTATESQQLSSSVKVNGLIEFTNKHLLQILIQKFNNSMKSNETTWYHVDVPSSTSPGLCIHFTPPSALYMKLRKAKILSFVKYLNVATKFVHD